MEVRRFESQRDGFMERNDWGDYVLFTDFEKVKRERGELKTVLEDVIDRYIKQQGILVQPILDLLTSIEQSEKME